jgi:hypothetical protein
MEQSVILNKDGFHFSKQGTNKYHASFSLETNKLRIPALINLDFMKVIYDLSPDLFETTSLEKLNETEGIITLLVKPLFEELGVSQKYLYLHVKCSQNMQAITFDSQTIHSQRPDGIPDDVDLVNVVKLTNEFTIHSNHKVDVLSKIVLDDAVVIPPFVDKIIGTLLSKIFKRVKQFIEIVVVK